MVENNFMVSVDSALQLIKDNSNTLGIINLTVDDALNYTLAEDVHSISLQWTVTR